MAGRSRRLDWLLPSWLEDSNAFDQSIDENMSTVGYTVLFNLVILALCVSFFAYYRRHDTRIFAPKYDLMPEKTPKKLATDTLFGWVIELYNISDETVIEKGGYDILFFLRFYRLSFKIFATFGIYAWLVILPVNATGQSGASSSTFEYWSMTNIAQGSPRCWFHLVGIFILTGITIYYLEKEFVIYAKHRHNYLRQRHAHLRTVLVQGVPYKMRSTATLATYFETLYPNSVLSVKLGQDLRYLDRLVEQRLEAVTLLERAIYRSKLTGVRPTVRVGNMKENIDAIRYYSRQLDDLNAAVEKEQEGARARSLHVDRLSKADAFTVIEGFLQVTEIGSIKRMLKEKTGSSTKWWLNGRASERIDRNSNSRRSTPGGSSTNIPALANNSNRDTLLVAETKEIEADDIRVDYNDYGAPLQSKSYQNGGYAPISSSSSAPSSSRPHLLRMYRMSWREWLWAMWISPSPWDCWRAFKDGPLAEDHSLIDGEESTALISPPEERRMYLSKAFVTFKTFTAATIARQVLHMQLTGHMAVSEAPEPTDVMWTNLYVTRTGTLMRRVLTEICVLFLIIIWVAPVTLLSFVVSEDALRGLFPFLDAWCASSEFVTSIVQLVQPGALVALMNVLPPILTAIAVLEGCISFSVNQFRSFDRYFTFQIINVFLVTTIAGSVIDCMKEIYKDPASAFSLLGGSLPKMGGFFTNYLIVKAFTGLGMEIMRFPAMFFAAFKWLLTSNLTPRDRMYPYLFGSLRVMANPGWFPFSKIYAQDALLVVVCATYACIAPLTIIAGLFYFAGASYIYKHQMLYVYEPIYETGGKWWPKLARCIVVALLFAQCTMVGMMILKETYLEIYFLGILILVTSLYYWYIVQTYVPLANQLPFDMATSIDLEQQRHPEELRGADDYTQPSLRDGVVHPEVEMGMNKVDLQV